MLSVAVAKTLIAIVKSVVVEEADSLAAFHSNEPVANGNHSKRQPMKHYDCAECNAPMRKRGEGLGHWQCTKNPTHGYHTAAMHEDGTTPHHNVGRAIAHWN